jgi:hypothetical protein
MKYIYFGGFMKVGDFSSLIIIAGSRGDLGQAFIKYHAHNSSALILACSRAPEALQYGPNIIRFGMPEGMFSRLLHQPPLPKLPQFLTSEERVPVTLIYPIGSFAFEALRPYPEHLKPSVILLDIYRTHIIGLRNFVTLAQNIGREMGCNVSLKIVTFGSVSNKHKPFPYPSYWMAKEAQSACLKNILQKRDGTDVPLSSLEMLVSTVNTAAERALRPNAPPKDRGGWLTVSDVVCRTARALRNMRQEAYNEVRYIKQRTNHYQPRYNSAEHWRHWIGSMSRKALPRSKSALTKFPVI